MSTPAVAELGDLAGFIRGITFKPGDVVPVGTPGAAACMRTKNVQAELDLSDVWGIPESFVRREDQFLAAGDILVSSANSWSLVGKCCWVPPLPWRSTFGGFISVLRSDPAKVHPRYLFHWFASDHTQTTLRSFGQQTTNISNLNFDRCLRLKLRLPSLHEQRRIAEILDQADSLRAQRRAALAKLNTLTQSIFLEMFGDPVLNPKRWHDPKLAGLVSEMRYGPRFYNEAYAADGIRIARITDLSDAGELDFEAMPRMRVSASDVEQFALQPGDVIFARSGATVGKVALFTTGDPCCIAGAYFIRLRFSEVIAPEYAAAVLSTKSIRELVQLQSRQSAQQNFSGPGLRRLPMPVPPLALQVQFARRLEAVVSQRRVQEQAIEETQILFVSLQNRAFRGEL